MEKSRRRIPLLTLGRLWGGTTSCVHNILYWCFRTARRWALKVQVRGKVSDKISRFAATQLIIISRCAMNSRRASLSQFPPHTPRDTSLKLMRIAIMEGPLLDCNNSTIVPVLIGSSLPTAHSRKKRRRLWWNGWKSILMFVSGDRGRNSLCAVISPLAQWLLARRRDYCGHRSLFVSAPFLCPICILMGKAFNQYK